MASDITLNSAVRSNLRTLQSTTELMNRTEERLSTGKKVNSALDNPSNYFTSQSLDRRATDLSSLLDSVKSSVKTLEAADNGIKSITDVVESLKATARSALQSPAAVETKAGVTSTAVAGLTADNLLGDPATAGSVSFNFEQATTLTDAADTLTFDLAIDGGATAAITINQAAVQAEGNGDTTIDNAAELRAILATAVGATATVGGTGTAVTLSSPTTGAASAIAITNFLETDADNDTTDRTGLGNASDTGSAAATGSLDGQTLIVKDRAGVDRTITFGTASGEISTIDQLNTFFDDNDIPLDASVIVSGANGSLKIETTNAAAYSTPVDLAGTIATGGNVFAASPTFSSPVLDTDKADVRANFVRDYNDALAQIDALARDSSYNGVNLLNGDDLEIIFNEDGTSKLEAKGVELGSAGIGLDGIVDEDFYDADSVNAIIEKIDLAFQTIEAQSSKFGSQLQIVQTRETFTKDMIGTLEDGSLALTGADTNEEAANLATLQTRQQLIVSSLSISTQQESAVLQLLQ